MTLQEFRSNATSRESCAGMFSVLGETAGNRSVLKCSVSGAGSD